MKNAVYWRGDWKRAGRYEDSDLEPVFRFERVPAPPEAQPFVETVGYTQSVVLGWHLRFACPKCMQPVELQWRREECDQLARAARAAGHGDATAGSVALAALESASEAKRREVCAIRRAQEQRVRAERAEREVRDVRVRLAKAQGKRKRWRKRGRR